MCIRLYKIMCYYVHISKTEIVFVETESDQIARISLQSRHRALTFGYALIILHACSGRTECNVPCI